MFYNPSTPFEGASFTGYLDIDFTASLFLLSNEAKTINEVVIFPNPTKDYFSVSRMNDVTGAIIIYSILGEKVLEQNINSDQTELCISGFSSDVYRLYIQADGWITTRKLVKN